VTRRDTTVTGGLDVSKTVRYRTLLRNPRAALVVDDLTVWSWGLNADGPTRFAGMIERRRIG
jgi:hypothetical protein